MKEKDDFALVPRAPRSLEKAEPCAKRVLSSMVADTLALAHAKVVVQSVSALQPGAGSAGEKWYEEGQRCLYGWGVPRDCKAGAKWLRMAAEQNHAEAQYELGLCYANGQGVEKDHAEAANWYRKAAEQNHDGAQTMQIGRAHV